MGDDDKRDARGYLIGRVRELGENPVDESKPSKRRQRLVSDPREIAGLVLETPGMVDNLTDALAGAGARGGYRKDVRATLLHTLVELADAWPEGDGWAIDNDGEVYRYTRTCGCGRPLGKPDALGRCAVCSHELP